MGDTCIRNIWIITSDGNGWQLYFGNVRESINSRTCSVAMRPGRSQISDSVQWLSADDFDPPLSRFAGFIETTS